MLEDDHAGALPSIRVKEGQGLSSLAQVLVSFLKRYSILH